MAFEKMVKFHPAKKISKVKNPDKIEITSSKRLDETEVTNLKRTNFERLKIKLE